jgi:photosystem II stability/assembly factor-like uncharacterized protein
MVAMSRIASLALVVGLLAIVVGGASARPQATLPTGTWKALGPAPIGPPFLTYGDYFGGPYSGRVTSVVVLSGGLHPGRLVIGSAGGGVWTSDNNGQTWTARTDTQADLAIGAVAVDPSNANHLLAGTGEANQSADSFPGDGILVSLNGGSSWTRQDPGGVFDGVSVAELAIVPGQARHEFAATNRGLFMTTNGGVTWAKPADGSYAAVDGNITAVAVNPATPTKVFVAGGPSIVAKSTDGGVHWAASASSIVAPSSDMPYTALAIAPSAPSVMYAAVGSQADAAAFYKSKDGGATWSAVTVPDYMGDAYSYGSGTEELGYYDNTIAIDPANQGHVLVGGIAVLETKDGGSTWRNLDAQQFQWPHNKMHPYTHTLAFGGGKVWMGSDGGVETYTPSTRALAYANGNLNISQLYAGFSVVDGTILAGVQGNSAARASSSRLSAWTSIYAGDGGGTAITPNNPSLQFIVTAGLVWSTTDAFATTRTLIQPPHTFIGLVNAPVAVIPNTSHPKLPTLFYGGPNLWRTANPGAANPAWHKVTTVGGDVSAIAVSPSNPNVVYAGFATGTIQVSTDGGNTFTSIWHEPGGLPFVTGISVDPSNPQSITASFSVAGTRSAPAQPHVAQYTYTTNPLSGAWTLINGNLPTAAVSHVVYDDGALLAATDVGVYGTEAADGFSTSWTPVGTGMPNVQVQDLAVVGGAVYAATYGRGAWRLP